MPVPSLADSYQTADWWEKKSVYGAGAAEEAGRAGGAMNASRVVAGSLLCAVLCYGSWVAVVGGLDRKHEEVMKNMPEFNNVKMEESRKRNALVMQALKEASETKENILRGIGGTER